MPVQLPSTDSGIRNVVSRIITSAMPSMPSRSLAPHALIHGRSKTACHPAAAGSKLHHRPIDSTNSATRTTSAIHRALPNEPSVTSASPGVSLPIASTTTAPTIGRSSSAGRIQSL